MQILLGAQADAAESGGTSPSLISRIPLWVYPLLGAAAYFLLDGKKRVSANPSRKRKKSVLRNPGFLGGGSSILKKKKLNLGQMAYLFKTVDHRYELSKRGRGTIKTKITYEVDVRSIDGLPTGLSKYRMKKPDAIRYFNSLS